MYSSKKDDGTIDQERVTCVICGAVLKYRGNSTGDTHPYEKEAHDRDETKSERSSLKRWLSSQRPLSQRNLGLLSAGSNLSLLWAMNHSKPNCIYWSLGTTSLLEQQCYYMQTLERTWVEKKNSIIACSLTVDGWSSNSDVHYLGITAHFIDDTWNFISLS
jgi:hypothetical protein